jgi:hypothetical protein
MVDIQSRPPGCHFVDLTQCNPCQWKVDFQSRPLTQQTGCHFVDLTQDNHFQWMKIQREPPIQQTGCYFHDLTQCNPCQWMDIQIRHPPNILDVILLIWRMLMNRHPNCHSKMKEKCCTIWDYQFLKIRSSAPALVHTFIYVGRKCSKKSQIRVLPPPLIIEIIYIWRRNQ